MTTRIEVDLSRLDGPEQVRAMGMAATAILMTMPHDEARIAVDRWLAAYRVEHPEPDVSRETADAEVVTSAPEVVTSGAPETRAEPHAGEEVVTSGEEGITPVTGSSHEYRGVTYQEKPRGRGAGARKPEAALKHAILVIEECATVEQLEAVRPELAALARWFADADLPELDQGLTKAVALRSGQLVNAEDMPADDDGSQGSYIIVGQTDVQTEESNLVGGDDDGEVAQAEVAEVEAEAGDEPDDVPFGPADQAHMGKALEADATKLQAQREGDLLADARAAEGNGAEEPLQDLARRGQDELGRKFLRDLLHKHGASRLSDLGPAEVAFRADLEAAL